MHSDHEFSGSDVAMPRQDEHRVVLVDGSDQARLAAVARLLAETAQRGEAVGLPSTITEAEYRDRLDELFVAVRRGDAGLAVAVTESGEVVGTAQWSRSKYQTQQVLAEVDRVAVLPGRRGGGLGGELVTAVCADARGHGVEVVNLTVRGNNHAAIALYERLGFFRAGLLPGVVAIGSVRHDVVIMCRVIDRPTGLDQLRSLPAGGGASLPRGRTHGPDWIRTERLLLCRPTPTDAEAHFAIHSDPATNLHLPAGPETDPLSSNMQIRKWAEHWLTDGYGYWTVRDLANGAVLGFGGIRPTPHHDYLNLGYRFRPSAWGNGYATEVGLAAVELAARVAPGLPVVALIQPANTASIRVAERIGLSLDSAAGLDEQGFARYTHPV